MLDTFGSYQTFSNFSVRPLLCSMNRSPLCRYQRTGRRGRERGSERINIFRVARLLTATFVVQVKLFVDYTKYWDAGKWSNTNKLSENSLDKRPCSKLPYCSENIQDCKVSKYIVVCLSEPFMAPLPGPN